MDHLKGLTHTEKQEGRGSWEFTQTSLTLTKVPTTKFRTRLLVLNSPISHLLRYLGTKEATWPMAKLVIPRIRFMDH